MGEVVPLPQRFKPHLVETMTAAPEPAEEDELDVELARSMAVLMQATIEQNRILGGIAASLWWLVMAALITTATGVVLIVLALALGAGR